MQELAALESQIVSARLFRELSADRAGQMSADGIPALGTATQALGTGNQALGAFEPARRRQSGARRCSGRVTFRFRVAAGTRRYYRWLERLFRRHGPPRTSFLRFLCCALIDAWKHALGSSAEYSEIYARDRYRCTSPVCGRRDVTPHHLKFRARGGDDGADNVASLCVWCHLDGIHGGRLSARPPASNITWTLGRNAHTVVRGRRRELAAHAISKFRH